MSDVMIEAHGLGKKYGSFVALRNSSFELRRGEILGLLGPNGAGKSTTMRILTCFIAPSEGTAKVNGCDIDDDPIGARSATGYLPESTPLYSEMLVKEYLDWVAAMRGITGNAAEKRVLEVIEEVGLEPKIAASINELSKGFKQRVGLAQALIHKPPILILDEPMAGLDPNQAAQIRELIKRVGEERSVILSTHNLAEVERTCSRVLVINRGQIVADDTPVGLARGEKGPRYWVSTSGRSTASDLQQIFSGIKGVTAVHSLAPKLEGETQVEIHTSTDDDLRPAILETAVANSVTLIEARLQNLERVFRELTGEEDAGGGKPSRRRRRRRVEEEE